MQALSIGGIPAVIYGGNSGSVYVYVHGMMGRKEDAEPFAQVAARKGFQVLSFDLPRHGERERNITPDPFNTLPELQAVHEFARSRWDDVSLYAVSLGAWFSLLHFQVEPPQNALLVSPVVNMKALIEHMMRNAGVTPEILRDRRNIPEANLSWEYYRFSCEHEISSWSCRTEILYPEHDNITPRREIEEFAGNFGCGLTVLLGAGHWIHEPDDVRFLREWEEGCIML